MSSGKYSRKKNPTQPHSMVCLICSVNQGPEVPPRTPDISTSDILFVPPRGLDRSPAVYRSAVYGVSGAGIAINHSQASSDGISYYYTPSCYTRHCRVGKISDTCRFMPPSSLWSRFPSLPNPPEGGDASISSISARTSMARLRSLGDLLRCLSVGTWPFGKLMDFLAFLKVS